MTKARPDFSGNQLRPRQEKWMGLKEKIDRGLTVSAATSHGFTPGSKI